ncbi:type II toxin-antitoxin system HicA family toxin [Aeromonas sobria]|uniref:type II toxin-antitoxin system HicA family toxin n=1 Tax=Aeromonas sobria TaxID=646 RepID=UPI001CA36B37|nr:type II toxin-antitoxin system HicA family toxin [Aeromonas sobria]
MVKWNENARVLPGSEGLKKVVVEVDEKTTYPQEQTVDFVANLSSALDESVEDESVGDDESLSLSRKHKKTLNSIFNDPVSGNIKWCEIEALFNALGAIIEEREGSRVSVTLRDTVRVFHRPHPSPDTDKGAVKSVRKFLENVGVKP